MDSFNEDVCNISCEEAQIILIRDNESKEDSGAKTKQTFLHVNLTQLPTFDLAYLNETTSNDEFTILFRNAHFSPPIFKNNGTLYTLITDVSFKKYKKIVWQSWIITMLLMTHCSNDPFFDRNFNDS